MTQQRKRSLRLRLPDGEEANVRPKIAAAFLARFHIKTGYSVEWSRNNAGLKLEGDVEYKSLPSGLHNVQEDLIYFRHSNQYIGVSAFVRNESTEESERHATMLAVGVLIPSRGRVGRSWTYADSLKQLAAAIAKDPLDKKPLGDFWQANKQEERTEDSNKDAEAGRTSPSSQTRAVSTASLLPTTPGSSLPNHHPAQSLPHFLDTFGPLIFPLYKAALLRKRILFVTTPPIETACDYVYDISLLSGIPTILAETLPLEPLPLRLDTLFSVGIHDIEDLVAKTPQSSLETQGYGWVSCTTDEILAHKPQLFDYAVFLPATFGHAHGKTPDQAPKKWPRIVDSSGKDIKATQRDLRRYRVLRRELSRFAAPRKASDAQEHSAGGSPLDLSRSLTALNEESRDIDSSSVLDANLAEPQSWSALAYDSFMWWASAGEKRTDLDEEEEHDAALMQKPDSEMDSRSSRSRSGSARSPGPAMTAENSGTSYETELITFFHRFTTLLLQTLAEIVDDSQIEEESDDTALSPESAAPQNGPNKHADRTDAEEETRLINPRWRDHTSPDEAPIVVEGEDLTRMGLDSWSESDQAFVRDLLEFYWGRTADVQGGRVDCCGIRVL